MKLYRIGEPWRSKPVDRMIETGVLVQVDEPLYLIDRTRLEWIREAERRVPSWLVRVNGADK